MSEGVNATVLTLEPERIFCEKGEPIVCTGRMTLHVPDALMAWCRGTDVTIYPGHEERLTREEWEAEAAVCPCEKATWDNCQWQWSRTGGRTTYADPGGECLECGRIFPPAPRPDPRYMSAEECEAELKAAEAVWICFRNYNMWQCHVVVGNERLEQTVHVDWRTKERALRAAVRALREHQAAQSRT